MPASAQESSQQSATSCCSKVSVADCGNSGACETLKAKSLMVAVVPGVLSFLPDEEAQAVASHDNLPTGLPSHTPELGQMTARRSPGHDLNGSAGPSWTVKINRVRETVNSTPWCGSFDEKLVTDDMESLKKIKEAKNRACEKHGSREIAEKHLLNQIKSSSTSVISADSRRNRQSPMRVTDMSSTAGRSRNHSGDRSSKALGHRSPVFSSLPSSPVNRPVKSNLQGHPQGRKKETNVNVTSEISHNIHSKFTGKSIHTVNILQSKEAPREHQAKKAYPELSVHNSAKNRQDETSAEYSQLIQHKKAEVNSPCNVLNLLSKSSLQNTSSSKKSVTELSHSEQRNMAMTSSKKMAKNKQIGSTIDLMKIMASPIYKGRETVDKVIDNKTDLSLTVDTIIDNKTEDFSVTVEKIIDNKTEDLSVTADTIIDNKTEDISVTAPDGEAEPAVTHSVLQSPERCQGHGGTQTDLTSSEMTDRGRSNLTSAHDETSLLLDSANPSVSHSVLAMLSDSTSKQSSTSVHEKQDISNVPDRRFHEQSGYRSVDISQLQSDYTKLLDWTSVKSKPKNTFQGRESETISQVDDFWHTTGHEREDSDKEKFDMAKLKRMNFHENVLSKAELDLESLALLFPDLENDYSEICFAQDTAEQQRRGVLQDTEEQKDLYEEKLERALRESEQLLAELSMLSGENMLQLDVSIQGHTRRPAGLLERH